MNNVTYNRYAESGRIQWAQKLANYVEPTKREAWVAPFFSKGIGMILKSITTDYKFVSPHLLARPCKACWLADSVSAYDMA